MRLATLLICGIWSAAAAAQDTSGLKVSAAVDLVGSYRADRHSSASDEFVPRAAEIMFSAPIDPTFDGVLSFAAHREDGESVAELHEAYIQSSRLIPRSNLRAGQFFLGVGRLNRLHTHEWPLISAPKVQTEFFGSEGVLDSGLEYSWLAPLPFFLESTLGVTNGFTYGHTHDAGQKPRQPTHYARLATYFEMPGNGGAQTALNYLSRTDAAQTRMTLAGWDFTAKWRDAGVLNLLIQSEVWHRSLTPEGAKSERTLGAYLLPQFALQVPFYLGLLIDYYSVLSLQDAIGRKLDNAVIAVVPTLTWQSSEFSTLRLAWHEGRTTREDQPDLRERRVEFQLSFMIGAHPTHDF